MAIRRPSRSVVTRAPRRKTVWIGTATASAVTVGAGASVVHSSFVPSALSMLAPTVVRVRGDLLVHPVAFGVDANWSGAYGLCLVSDEALAIGETAIPRAFDDDDWSGWLVHGYFTGHLEFQSSTSELVMPQVQVIDSKSMRKVGVNESLVWMFENNSSVSVRASLQARVLVKLS